MRLSWIGVARWFRKIQLRAPCGRQAQLFALLSGLAAVLGMPVGAVGQALQVNEPSGFAQRAHHPALNALPLTVSAWIRTTDTNDEAGVVNKYLSGSGNGWNLFLNQGVARAWYFGSPTNTVYGSGGLNGGLVADGAWHVLTFVVNTNGGRLYIDGTLRDSLPWNGAPASTTTTQALAFGNYPRSYGDFVMAGELDEVGVWNVALDSNAVQQLTLRSPELFPQGLLGAWRFEEGAGPSAMDSGPQGWPATLLNNAGWAGPGSWAGGWPGQGPTGPVEASSASRGALQTTSAGRSAQAAHHDELNALPITVSAWVKTSMTTGIAGLTGKYVASSLNGWNLFLRDGLARAWYFGSATNYVFVGPNGLNGGFIADGQWHLLTFVTDTNGGRYYVDGVLKDSLTWTGAPGRATTTTPVTFGDYPTPGGHNFLDGLVDEVGVWNIALDTNAIQQLLTRPPVWLTNNLIAAWRFGEAEGVHARDSSGHGRTAALLNGAVRVTPGAPVETSVALYPLPTVSTLPADGVGESTLTLRGQVNAASTNTYAWFEYGTNPASLNLSNVAALLPVGVNLALSASLNGLPFGTRHHFRLVAANPAGRVNGAILSAETLPAAAPVAYTAGVTNVGETSIRLVALVGTNGVAPRGRIEWGVSPALGNLTPERQPDGSTSRQSFNGAGCFRFEELITGLTPGQSYYWRVAGRNGAGTNTSPVVRFQVARAGSQDASGFRRLAPSDFSGTNNPIQALVDDPSVSVIILPAGRFVARTVIPRSVTIRGQGRDLTVISGFAQSWETGGSVFTVTNHAQVVFEDFTITEGRAENGGGIHMDSSHVTLRRSRVTRNAATGVAGEGGGIYNRGGGLLELVDSEISENTSRRNGGGLSNSGLNTTALGAAAGATENGPDLLRALYGYLNDFSHFQVEASFDFTGQAVLGMKSYQDIIKQIVSQIAARQSAAELANPGESIQTGLAERLFASEDGLTTPLARMATNRIAESLSNAVPGGFDVGTLATTSSEGLPASGPGWTDLGSPVTFVLRSVIRGNSVTATVSGFGGGVHNDLGLVLFQDSEVTGNRVETKLAAFGGGINSLLGSVKLTGTRVEHNVARSASVLASGGGLLAWGSRVEAVDSRFNTNSVEALHMDSGGGLKSTFFSRATLLRCDVSGNTGGGVANDYLSTLGVGWSTVHGNFIQDPVAARGAGLYNAAGGETTVTNSSFAFNEARGRARGGAVFNQCSGVWIYTLNELGTPIISESKVTLANCTVVSNRVFGESLQVPSPQALASCLIQQAIARTVPGGIPPPCDFESLPTMAIELSAKGGGLFNSSSKQGVAKMNLRGCTVAMNSAEGARAHGGGFAQSAAGFTSPLELGLSVIDLANVLAGHNLGGDYFSEYFGGVDLPLNFVHASAPSLDSDGSLLNMTGGEVVTWPDLGLQTPGWNGGPTLTVPLLPESPAVNAANPDPFDSGPASVPGIDQRGFTRVGRGDIGAFERVAMVAVADSYRLNDQTTLLVESRSGVLSNDRHNGASAQLATAPAHGTLVLRPDGSFLYTRTNSSSGSDVFFYRLVEGSVTSAVVSVTIDALVPLELVAVAPAAHNGNLPVQPAISAAFNLPLLPASGPGRAALRGAQSPTPWPSVGASGVNLSLQAGRFHAGERVTASFLPGLSATTGETLPRPWQFDYLIAVTNGTGAFRDGGQLSSPEPGLAGPTGVATGDLDGDGLIDLVFSGASGVEVWRNAGSGQFTWWQRVPGWARAVALGDFNGDGFLDVAVAGLGGTIFGPCRVLFNDGSGRFTPGSQQLAGVTFQAPGISGGALTLNAGSSCVAVADLDGDGSLDLVFGNNYTPVSESQGGLRATTGNSVWLNNGRGVFRRTGQTLGSLYCAGVAVGDLNGDGFPDLYFANHGLNESDSSRDEIWWNDGTGQFNSGGALPQRLHSTGVALGDVDGDGDLDAVVAALSAESDSGQVVRGGGQQVFLNDGHGHFATGPVLGGMRGTDVAVGDLNGDGRPDVIVGCWDRVELYMSTAPGQFSFAGNVSRGQEAMGLALADLDNDGDLDVAAAQRSLYALDEFYNAAGLNRVWFNIGQLVAANDTFTLNEDTTLNLGASAGLMANDRGDLASARIATRKIVTVTGTNFGPYFAFRNTGVTVYSQSQEYVGTYPNGQWVWSLEVPVNTTNGTIDLREDGSFTYRPNTNFHGVDGFDYVLVNGPVQQTAHVMLIVNPVNDPPVARTDFYYGAEAAANVPANQGVLTNDFDADGNALTAQLVAAPLRGSLDLRADGSFTYTRAPGATGGDVFTYQAWDGQVASGPTRVKLGNTPAVSVDDSLYAMPLNGQLTNSIASGVLANDFDADGDALSAVLAEGPAHGSVQLNPDGSFTYARTPGYTGNDAFTYWANDGFTGLPYSQMYWGYTSPSGNFAFVNIQAFDDYRNLRPARVKIGNAAPAPAADSYPVFVNKSLNIPAAQGVLANDTDPDGDPLTATLVTGPAHGSMTLSSNGGFNYVPQANYTGSDSFTYLGVDPAGASTLATVTLDVLGELQLTGFSPARHSYAAPTNTVVDLWFNAPINAGSLSNRIRVHGDQSGLHDWTAIVSSNRVTLAFPRRFLAGEEITVALLPLIRATSPFGLAEPRQFAFWIGSPKGGGSFTHTTVGTVNRSSSLAVAADFTGDSRPDALVFDWNPTQPPLLYRNNGNASFTEEAVPGTQNYLTWRSPVVADFNGDGRPDVAVVAADLQLWLNTGNGSFAISRVNPANLAPFYLAAAAGDFNGDGAIDLVAVVTEPSPMLHVWWNNGSGGFTRGPDTAINAPGSGTPALRAHDLDGDGFPDLYLAGSYGESVLLNDRAGHFTGVSRPDSDWTIATALADFNGDGSLDVVAEPIFSGFRGAQARFNDGGGHFRSSGQLLQLNIHSSAVAAGDLNGDGVPDFVEAKSGGGGTNTLFLNTATGAGQFNGRSLGNAGADSRSVALADFDGDGDLDAFFAVGVSVPGRNFVSWNQAPPLARDDIYAYAGGSLGIPAAAGVTNNDTRGDGGAFTVQLVSPPASGALTLNADGSFNYSPAGGATTASFTYRLADSLSTSRVARVKLGNTIPSVNNDGPYLAVNDTPIRIPASLGVLANDTDSEADPLTARLFATPTRGTVDLRPDGSFTYTAQADYVGTDSFSYQAIDGMATSAVATVTLDVRKRLSVVEVLPVMNEQAVQGTNTIVVLFSQPVDAATLPNQITVASLWRGRQSFTSTLAGTTLTIDPAADFWPGDEITVTVGQLVRGVTGEAMPAPFTWSFKVAAPFGRGQFTDSGQRLYGPDPAASMGNVTLADADGDGDLDAFVIQGGAFTSNGVFQVGSGFWINNGSGAFTKSSQTFGTNTSRRIRLADVDGDGDQDVLVASTAVQRLWFNNAGTFTVSTQNLALPGQNFGWDYQFADVNGDGRPDVLGLADTNFIVLTNNGAGGFADSGQRLYRQDNNFGYGFDQIEVADLDHDGDLDVAARGSFTEKVFFMINDGQGRFTMRSQSMTALAQNLALGDLNGDGHIDCVLLSGTAGDVWMNDGSGRFNKTTAVLEPSATNYSGGLVRLADLDGDGSLDIATSCYQSSANSQSFTAFNQTWFNDGHGQFANRNIRFGTNLLAGFGIGDLDRDGTPDLFLAGNGSLNNQDRRQPVMVWRNAAGLGPVEGSVSSSFGDNVTNQPFAATILRGPAGLPITLTITLDSTNGGDFTAASLASAGFVRVNSTTLSRAAGPFESALTALRQLVFAPVRNRLPVGQSEATRLLIVATDTLGSRTNTTHNVSVVSLNDSPIAFNDAGPGFTTSENTPIITASALANDSDPDPGTVLSILRVDLLGTQGTVSNLANGTFHYTPAPQFRALPAGATTNDSFRYIVSDGFGSSATGLVTIAVTGVNNAPVATNDSVTVIENAGPVNLTGTLLANDMDPDMGETASLEISAINTNGTLGRVTLSGGVMSYDPTGRFANLAPGQSQTDQFAYTVRDAAGATASATVMVTVSGTNDAPLASANALTLLANVKATNLTSFVLGNDSDPDPAQGNQLQIVSVDNAGTVGLLTLTNHILFYDPAGLFDHLPAGSNAVDVFTYQIADAADLRASATVSVTIQGVNEPPTAVGDALALPLGAQTNLTALLLGNDIDPDDGEATNLVLHAVLASGASGGLTFTNGQLFYCALTPGTLAAGQTTNDLFHYVVRDSGGLTSTGVVTITIAGAALAPLPLDDAITVARDGGSTNLTWLALANDVDPNPGESGSLKITSVFTNATRGRVTLTNGVLTYSPNGAFGALLNGSSSNDVFLYTVTDPSGASSMAGVVVTIITPPAITSSPTSRTVSPGSSVSLHAAVNGQPVPILQWHFNGVPVPSASAIPLLIPNFQSAQEGRYTLSASNVAGLAWSADAEIYLNSPVRLTNSVWSNGVFHARLIGASNATYLISSSSNLTDWVPLQTNASPSGLSSFSDTATNTGPRAYRVQTPP